MWRSDWKWQRVAPHLAPLKYRKVLDVGGGSVLPGFMADMNGSVNALLLRGTEGESVADARRTPAMDVFKNGQTQRVQAQQEGSLVQVPELPGTDALATATYIRLVLANELAVLHDRLDSAERVHAAKGLDLAAEIEALQLDQAALEAREAWRQDFLGRLFYLARKDASEAAAADTAERFRATIEDIAQT